MRIGKALTFVSVALLVALPGIAFATRLPEGTDVRLRMAEKLTSATATEGQRFDLVLDEDVQIAGVVVVPRGAKAVGTVVSVHKRGHMGKAGDLNIQINYLVVGEQRVPLRASNGREGDGRVGSTVVLTVLFGPLGLLKRGKDVEINPGTVLTAQIDQTTELNISYPSPSTPSSSGMAADSATSAYANESGPAAKSEFAKLGCSESFSLVSSSGGRSIFEAQCSSGKRQLLECHGAACSPLN